MRVFLQRRRQPIFYDVIIRWFHMEDYGLILDLVWKTKSFKIY